MNFKCSFCENTFDLKIRNIPEIENIKFACKNCCKKILNSNFNTFEIITEEKLAQNDSHLNLLSFCVKCNKPLITRPRRRIKALNNNMGFCDKCNRINQAKKLTYNNLKPGKCIKCGCFNKNRDITGIGKDCGCYSEMILKRNQKQRENNQKPGNCIKCDKFCNKRDILGRGIDCGCSKNGYIQIYNNLKNSGKIWVFDSKLRKDFYDSQFELTTFKSCESLIENFNELNGVAGVWALKGTDNIIYDVAQTQNIGKEMFKYLRRLNYNKGLSDNDIIEENKRYKYNRKKYRNITNDCSQFEFILICKNKDKIKREEIEAQYAHDNKAKYWSPAPSQLNNIMKAKEIYDF